MSEYLLLSLRKTRITAIPMIPIIHKNIDKLYLDPYVKNASKNISAVQKLIACFPVIALLIHKLK